MEEQIASLRNSFIQDLEGVQTSQDLEFIKVKYLGKKGPIQALMQNLRNCPPEQRPEMGKVINLLKEELEKRVEEQNAHLSHLALQKRLHSEKIDVTLPGRRSFTGRPHPITQMLDEVLDVLIGMGFSIQYSPEIETEYYNYGGLNYPEDHPARDMQDTFYLDPQTLLRSHTTSIQQHILENEAPPIRIAAPGKCYRNETITARSHVFFHQVDVLYIDKQVTFADLIATKRAFYNKLFDTKIELRVRPSYFPFVEPGMEVDINCLMCGGKGCRVCKHTGWLEVAGAGMVHPSVLKQGGLDPDVYSGFAWGGGIERLFMLRHSINDIRLFTENDLRFLSQF